MALASLLCVPAGVKADGHQPTADTFVEGIVFPPVVNTTLYLHPTTWWDMPINTQQPATDYHGEAYSTHLTPTLTCLHPITGPVTGGTTSQAYSTYRGFSSPSFVEYDHGERPRVHNVRGLGHDVPLQAATLHWYLVSEPLDVLANIVVEAAIQASNSISGDDPGYDGGTVLAQGQSRPVTAAAGEVRGDGMDQVSARQVGDRWVYAFEVPLETTGEALPADWGYVVRLDVRMDVPGCMDGQTIAQPGPSPYHDALSQARIEVRHGDALRSKALVAAAQDTLLFALRTVSPWGAYDVRTVEDRLVILGPADIRIPAPSTVQYLVEYYHQLEPVRQDWSIPAAEFPDGQYTAVFSTTNLQQTAVVETRVSFRVQDGRLVNGPSREADAVGLVTIGLLLAGMVFATRLGRKGRP